MGTYVDIDGHQTWVDDRGGKGEPLLLMHGGLSNSDALLDSIGPRLMAGYHVVAFDRRGHGRTADTPGPFHYADMVKETVQVLEQVVGAPAHLVGWSDGGILALLVALERPELAKKLVVIGTNYHHEGLVPFEPNMEAPFFQQIFSAYAERSPDGAAHMEEILGKTFTMFASEPTMTTADVARITQPTLVMAGDDDLISLAHTASLYEALPNAQLAIVPGASHGLPIERPELVAGLISDFLASEGADTLVPIRRA